MLFFNKNLENLFHCIARGVSNSYTLVLCFCVELLLVVKAVHTVGFQIKICFFNKMSTFLKKADLFLRQGGFLFAGTYCKSFGSHLVQQADLLTLLMSTSIRVLLKHN